MSRSPRSHSRPLPVRRTRASPISSKHTSTREGGRRRRRGGGGNVQGQRRRRQAAKGRPVAAATAATAAAPVVELARAPDDAVEHARCVIFARADKCNLSAPSGHDKRCSASHLIARRRARCRRLSRVPPPSLVNLPSIRSYASGPRSGYGRVDFIATCEGHDRESSQRRNGGSSRRRATLVRVLGSFAVPQGPWSWSAYK